MIENKATDNEKGTKLKEKKKKKKQNKHWNRGGFNDFEYDSKILLSFVWD